jgi:hypothetical protein
MKTLIVNLPIFGLAVATRAALGVGIGLLIADRLSADRRRRLGIALVTVGAATTVPIVSAIVHSTARGRDPVASGGGAPGAAHPI